MPKAIQKIISTNVANKMYELIEDINDPRNPEFYEDEEIIEKLHSIQMSLRNHEEVIEQNRQLQSELNALKRKPFFPYELNSGNGMDFGEFILISHAWFTIPKLPAQLGIVEVEWKSSGIRKMYIGCGSTNGRDFKKDVLAIALHGQKIKDASEIR